jgi:hypothetical protein
VEAGGGGGVVFPAQIYFQQLIGFMMKRQNIPPEDDYEIRCPRLGHQISFSYCRSENRGLPCFKTLDCWYDHFLVEEYFRKELTSEEWDKAFKSSGTTKMLSLLELIEQAKKGTKEE